VPLVPGLLMVPEVPCIAVLVVLSVLVDDLLWHGYLQCCVLAVPLAPSVLLHRCVLVDLLAPSVHLRCYLLADPLVPSALLHCCVLAGPLAPSVLLHCVVLVGLVVLSAPPRALLELAGTFGYA
jgi:hypothetical protein